MAAPHPDGTVNGRDSDPGSEPGIAHERNSDPWSGAGPIVKREPAVKLLNPVSGLEPLAWSEDHRVSAASSSSVAVMEVLCDPRSGAQDLLVQRSSIPLPDRACVLKVGPEEEVQQAKDKLASSKDPAVSQAFMLDRVMNPNTGSLAPLRGMKYACWSPLGCDSNGRSLLASLTLDGRLTLHGSPRRLHWSPLVDLTDMYGRMLEEKGYSLPGAESPLGSLDDPAELRRRYRMQSPVRMEWSGVCTTQEVQTNNECKDVGTVLLAVLMENGDVVVWHFQLPFVDHDSVVSCNTIRSGVSAPSVLAWWEYEHGGRKMSGLIVGSSVGPVKILPVNLRAIKGYFTLRQPVVLWQETDQIPVHNIKCISLFHPHQKCNCSLVVAARGPYVFWCLLLITKAGLNVHNSHVTGLHSTPIISMATNRYAGSIFTCSLDGSVKKLKPIFTEAAVTFKQEQVALPEGVAGRRMHGIALSPSGAYLALVSADGLVNGQHPVSRNYQVQFITLKTPEEAAAELLSSTIQNLFQQADLLDLVRLKVLQDKRIPPQLLEKLDDKLHTCGTPYPWRLKLFLYRVLYQSRQKASAEAQWWLSHEDTKVFIADEEAAEEDGEEPSTTEDTLTATTETTTNLSEQEGGAIEEQTSEIIAWIEEMESHLAREHMKQVLGEVYLHTWITENTSIPTRGVCDFLSSDTTYNDRTAKVLIGHIFKKMNKQTFPEYCSLCKEVLPFTDHKQAVCSNGHIWLRCVLTYQACQSLKYRRCLLQDSIARYAVPEDPDWIKRILQGPCTFCDFPLC